MLLVENEIITQKLAFGNLKAKSFEAVQQKKDNSTRKISSVYISII
jgi:hypothetical protein